MNRVLVVDPDRDLCQMLLDYLHQEGFEVEIARGDHSGVERATTGEHTIALLDATLARTNGLDALRRIRNASQIPVIILTEQGADGIIALEMGADDYLQKPLNPRELLARIRAIVRRTRLDPMEATAALRERLSIADIELDRSARMVLREGQPVTLTVVEFDLLEAMMRQAGRVVTREELVKLVLGRNYTPSDRSIDTHISNLRRKLGHRVGLVERIRTIRGIGYIYMHANGLKKR